MANETSSFQIPLRRFERVALTRFGLGITPTDAANMAGKPIRWLYRQTEGPAAYALQPFDHATWRRVTSWYSDLHLRRRQLGDKRRAASSEAAKDRLEEERIRAIRALGDRVTAQKWRHYQRQLMLFARTEEPVKERLVQFWLNHFAMNENKHKLVEFHMPYFERQVVRQNLNGRFADMLFAATTHPAMLVYLDNQKSVGPNSLIGQSNGKGLNENLGRELLELHSLGVAGGYDQDDVIGAAKVLTGWRFNIATGQPVFQDKAHEPGAHQVLGQRYGGDPSERLRQLSEDLAMNEATARHLAYKLVQHFGADTPREEDVDAVSAAYLASGGDLGETYRAVFRCRSLWHGERQKIKQPWEVVATTLHMTGFVPDRTQTEHAAGLQAGMGQPVYQAPGPQGWYDRKADWSDAGSLVWRVKWAAYAADWLEGEDGRMPLGDLIDVIDPPLPARRTIAQAQTPQRKLALLFANPSFQWR